MADKPKLNMSRRGFLGLLGGGIAAALTGGLKTAPKVAATAAKVIPEISAQGMPTWFPSLVNKIKTQGKQTTTATGGRNSMNTYTLKSPDGDDYILYEDGVSGNIQISTRGDDFQQVSFEYIPGTKYSRPDGKSFVEESEFYTSEFQKGEFQDYENTLGGVEDLKLGISNIEEFANKGKKTSKEQLDELASEFKRITQKEELDFAKGGRVGYNNGGGVGTLFRRKKHNG